MKNGWTGGQFSLYRLAFGIGLLLHFAFRLSLRFSDVAWLPASLCLGILLSVLFAIGVRVKFVGLSLLCLLVFLGLRESSFLEIEILRLSLPLAVFLFLHKAPFGSWDARGRVDPDDGWNMPPLLFGSLWGLLGMFYAFCGYENFQIHDRQLISAVKPALGLAFIPLGLVPKFRPWLWLVMLLLHLGFTWQVGFQEFSLGLLALQGITFDPAWIGPRTAPRAEILFFDGSCGLCHRFIRMVLAEERNAIPVRIAPLGGAAFMQELTEKQRASLPDSLVLKTWDNRLLLRTDAVCHLLHRFGGLWRLFAIVLWLIPRHLRDGGYKAIAQVRYRLFARPAGICPLMPPHLHKRFEM